ncbi:hypothetical protein KC332_g1591 [Hortaea werneckii]|nr:hypothetical protein KC332_g1591 [Hortaea werneckii]
MQPIALFLALLASTAVALPSGDTATPQELTTPNEDSEHLFKRYSSCSNGNAVNCGSASTSCSGKNCKVCCGSCCKKVTEHCLQ